MAKFRQVSPKIWNDAKFRTLSDNGKLVFFMLLTHPHTSSIGTLRAYYQGLAAELGWSVKAFQEAFQEAFQKGMVKADERAGLIWLPNFTKYNLPQSPNVIKSWAGALDDCPECSLKNQIFQNIKSLSESLSKAFQKAFMEAFGKGMPNQEQEQEQEQEKEKEKTFCAAPENSAAALELFPREIFIRLPLNDNSEYEVELNFVMELEKLYPAVDVKQEFNNMRGWCIADPKRRKTKGGIKRFINSWLANVQNNPRPITKNKLSSQNAPTPKTFQQIEEERELARKEQLKAKLKAMQEEAEKNAEL